MAEHVQIDTKEIQQLKKQYERMGQNLDAFYERAAKELAARLLTLVIPETPVGDYPEKSGKKGGTLRRGWTSKTHVEAATRTDDGDVDQAKAYANSLPVVRKGRSFEITVENPVRYSPYVEYGHRTRGGKDWVEGKSMLTLSEQEVRDLSPGILENILKAMIKEASNGQ